MWNIVEQPEPPLPEPAEGSPTPRISTHQIMGVGAAAKTSTMQIKRYTDITYQDRTSTGIISTTTPS
ncbi:hypothetical protein V6C27_13655 [Peptococcaceae bacterium 1198_IL3148]